MSTTQSDYLRSFLPDVEVTGQLDVTKASGDISGTATLAIPCPVPATLGGLWSAGVTYLPLSAIVTVEYAFSYTLTRIPGFASVPAAASRPPPSRAIAHGVVPAFTSAPVAPRLTAAALMCGGGGGP